ncbi:MAG TPA: T9SS type A sorting domain-containing protein [Saprospiraceae bacterium]|nr:T9SS type A sorting domain-containing protein [Saprospiraceae bacterium]
MNRLFLSSLLVLVSLLLSGQSGPFQIRLEPHNIPGFPGIQSFAFGQYEGKWVIIGGRLDGLHRRQPFAAFDPVDNNFEIYVVDPGLSRFWKSSIAILPAALHEPLSSSNMQFYQEGKYLYLIGGYGFSRSIDNHRTFDALTAVDLSFLTEAVVNGTSILPAFRQINDQAFAVTGGQLRKINEVYHLVGGQKFDGAYNPMGHATFTQQYTNQARRFKILDNGTQLRVEHLSTYTDTAQFHRRDYNVVPQILPNGDEGLTAFSGVFQTKADIPYLGSVSLDRSGYQVDQGFAQYYNHYHCAHLGAYDKITKEMHSVFFGGIAQYYEQAGMLVQDNEVPFVKTISRVTRFADGRMAEFRLPVEMPDLLGAGAELIPVPELPEYANGVLDLNRLTSDTTMIGYIVGGIRSSAPNIFWNNDGSQSQASPTILKVQLIRSTLTGTDQLNPQSREGLFLQVFPNPNDGHFQIQFQLAQAEPVRLTISDESGKTLLRDTIRDLQAGPQQLTRDSPDLEKGGTFFIRLETETAYSVQKIIARP